MHRFAVLSDIPMKIRDIDRFFLDLSRHVDFPVEVIITGGAAALLHGGRRVTRDIDFEAHVISPSSAMRRHRWRRLEIALREVARQTGITPQYTEDIDRWSAIAMPSHPLKKSMHKIFGQVRVYLLDPAFWAVGKLARYLPGDLQDLRVVLKKQNVEPKRASRLWGKALAQSPSSSAQIIFRRQVAHFFKAYAQSLWGKRTDPAELEGIFLRVARRPASCARKRR